MRKCLKIHVLGKVQAISYRTAAQKHAQNLGIEGVVQNAEDESVIIYACGPSDNLDKFIDFLYKGTSDSKIIDLIAEPFVNEKDFRGVFRIIGD
jgi:acylphosphatase